MYIEAVPWNLITNIVNFKAYINKKSNRDLQNIGYSFKLLFFQDLIPCLEEFQVELINDKDSFLCPLFKDEKMYTPRISIFHNVKDEVSEKKICHINSAGGTCYPFYRRYFLNEKLKQIYQDDLATNHYLGKFEVVIISHPTEIIPKGNKIIYERTDNWSEKGYKDGEELLFKISSCIICSSKFLYFDTIEQLKNNNNEKAKVFYIPNGNKMFKYPKQVEKYTEKTAIYIGNSINKVDIETLFNICEENPDWNFFVYANEKDEPYFENSPINIFFRKQISLEDIFQIVCKCKLGLINFKGDAWTDGMLPNKLFTYINAKIPTLYSGVNEINLEDYKEVTFKYEKGKKIEELVNFDIQDSIFEGLMRDWDSVTNEILNVIQKEMIC